MNTPKPGNQSLAVAWVHPGQVQGLFMDSVCKLLLTDSQRAKPRIKGEGGTIAVRSGPRIAHARNEIVQGFLNRTRCEWLLMVDTDMVFKPEDVETLFSRADLEHPIVGGLCFGGGVSGTMFPTLFLLVDPTENDGDPIKKVYDYPTDALCRVDATGAAFLLMHRSALEKMGTEFCGPAPWFSEGTVYKGATFGEDWAFCLRAKSLEIPVYVHTGARIGHIKSHVLDEDAYRQYQVTREQIGDEGLDAEFRSKFGMEKV